MISKTGLLNGTNKNSKIIPADVHLIRLLKDVGYTQRMTARTIGASSQIVAGVLSGRHWHFV